MDHDALVTLTDAFVDQLIEKKNGEEVHENSESTIIIVTTSHLLRLLTRSPTGSQDSFKRIL